MESFDQRLAKAKKLAEDHHKNLYGNGLPYTYHLQRVQDVLGRFGFGPHTELGQILFIAAWLHDIVEDTDITIDQVEEMFGPQVRSLVWAVTNEPGPNRAERHKKTYPKIRHTPNAIILKLADRIANVEQCIRDYKTRDASKKGDGKPKIGMYVKERASFNELFVEGEQAEMWLHLNRLFDDPEYAISVVT